ncbi:MAG: valine--tRNA ligase [Bdellovibrionales bacterium]|nr:valine--tRNA ligase [Bdellovibrionales bacterium]
MPTELTKNYDPKCVETRIYAEWENAGCFGADATDCAPPFTIVIPPPNVTGVLHMGHALDNTLQDILVRYKRMSQFATLWVPGTDHAGIATQNVVEKQLEKEGIERKSMDREAFLKRVWEWKEKSGGQIIHQLKRLGASCDWSRERFTMDEGLSKAVRQVFVTLYKENLIYRSNYLVSWCPRCQTALSDLEVEHENIEGKIVYFKYPLGDGRHIMVATTRPETMLGDTAIAVNPKDKRYKDFIGQEVIHPLTQARLKIISDSYVDQSFGTGAVKITPAHDVNDYELGKRHQLNMPTILNEVGQIELPNSIYHGLDRFEARNKIIEDLKALGLFEKSEPHQHAVGHCQRCRTIIEPRISDQWFVKIKSLADPAIAAVKNGQTRFVPEHWTDTYLSWMENIRDWCISRQLWWGHRIPVWYCQDCDHQTVSIEDPVECESCASPKLIQDPDVLDTWFSSALWPFSTLGWPDASPDLKKFYPTSVLVTGFDIIFFWVARMMMMGLKFMKAAPFEIVHIHALVRDEHGKKMSKSKGNVIDPLVLMDQYGTDAFRFALASFSIQGRDILLSVKRIEGYRNFITKLWNAGRFLRQSLSDKPIPDNPSLADQWILERLSQVTEELKITLESMKFNEAADLLYQFIWHEYCDWYLEMQKVTPNYKVALHAFNTILHLLHPLCPFVTEELYQTLIENKPSPFLMLSLFPKAQKQSDSRVLKTFDLIQSLIESIRNFRSENKIAPSKKLTIQIAKESSKTNQDLAMTHKPYVLSLAGVQNLFTADQSVSMDKTSKLQVQNHDIELIVSWEGLIDTNAEKERITKQLDQARQDQKFLETRLQKKSYRDKAPKHLIERDEQKLKEASTLVKKYESELKGL